jgi:DNA-binding transcriptional ArsR family regulator
MESEDIVKALAALAQTSRLDIFKALVVAGSEGQTPTDLAEKLHVTPSALSFHLKELTHAGLIAQERSGRNLVYRAQFDYMNVVLSYLTDNCCQGQTCEMSAPTQCQPSNIRK